MSECAQLRAELAALRAEVARLKPVDEESIVKKAIVGAQALLKPEIAGVAVVAAGAVKQSGIATNLAQYATTEAFQATARSRSAAVVADLAKKSAQGAVSLSEIASMKAGTAFSTATKAQAESAIAKALSTSANTAATAATATATKASGLALAAQNVANGANALANSAIGKVLLLAANVLSLAGSIAGLFALYATLKIVFPRLDAHDRQLAQHDSELSKQMSLIVRNAGDIKTAQATADKANLEAEFASRVANRASGEALAASRSAGEAINRSNSAIGKAQEATSRAETATGIANEATTKSLAAIGVAQVAERKAVQATNRANESFRKSEDALSEAGAATSTARSAEREASNATGIANRAIGEVGLLQPKVASAQKEATEAKTISKEAVSTATDANSKANTANNKADTALGQIPPIRDKADTALSNSQGALLQSGAAINISTTALNLANNALNRVPTTRDLNPPNLRSPELESRINRLETKVNEQEKMNEQVITKIDNLPRIIEPTIVNSVTKTVNAVVPISIERASADIKNTFENISVRNQKALEPQFQRVIDNQRASNNEIINSINTPLVALPNLVADRVRQVDRPVVITQPRDTETLEKLAQVVVGVGALKIGLDNMPRNIAKSPDLLNTIVQGTTTANCRTAAPSGCTGKAINNGINAGNNDLKKYLDGLLKAGNTALELDTNARVKDLQGSAKALKTVAGVDDFPMTLPQYLLDDFVDVPVIIPNQPAYNVWLLKQIDALVGLFPIKIERVDENGQKQMLVFENIAEAIAELTGLIAQVAFDADTAVNVATRATGEAIGAKSAALQAGSYLKAIVDYMGFQGQAVSIDVPISVTPGAVGLDGKLQESELKDFLKPSTQKAIGFKNTDPVDQRLVLQRILQSGEISRAALFRPLKADQSQNPLTGDAIKADKTAEKKRIDDLWDAFKLRMEGHTGGTKVDIDDGLKPTDGATSP